MRSAIKDRLKEAAILVGISLALFCAIEGVLRMISPFHFTSAYVFDERYLVRLKPGVTKTFKRARINGGQRIRWRSNSHGFRGAEIAWDADHRIMVYGDSNIQARFSAREDTYTHRLERRLRERTGAAVEVLNGGVIGFGPDQSLIRFQEEVKRYRPDVVILHLFADNDFGDISRNGLFALDDQGRLIRSSAPPTEDQLLRFPASLMMVREATNLVRAVANRLHPERATVEAGLLLCQAEYAVYHQRQARRFSHFADHYDFDVALYPNHPASQDKIRLMGEILKAAASFATAQEIPLLVLIQPSARDLTATVSPNKNDFAAYPAYRPENLSALMAGLSETHGIPYINLWDVFATNDPAVFYLKDDDHWNEAGQDLAAQVTAARLLEDFSSVWQSRRGDESESGRIGESGRR